MPPELARLPEVVWARRRCSPSSSRWFLRCPRCWTRPRSTSRRSSPRYLIVALSLLVLSGWAGQISLGQFAFVATGSSVGAWLTLHWHMDVLLVMVVAGSVGAVVAVAIGIPALRIRGLFLAAATLAFTLRRQRLLPQRLALLLDPEPVHDGATVAGLRAGVAGHANRFYYFSYAILLLCVFAVLGLRRSRIGRVLVATRENERGVQAYGVNVTRAKLVAFATSGFLAAVAGVLILYGQETLYPGGADPQSSIGAFVTVVIGGLGSMTGVFAGAIYYEGLTWLRPEVPQAFQNVLALLGTGVGLILILMFLPGGVGSLIYQIRDRLLRRVAARHDVVVPSLIADMAVRNDAQADAVIEQADADALVEATA